MQRLPRSRRRAWVLALILFAPLTLRAEDKVPAERTVNDRQIIDLLASIHDRAAMLYNAGDYSGCYRLFEGSLLTIKPLLPRDAQDMITISLPNAEQQPGMARRAMLLHELMEGIRTALRQTAGPAAAPLPPPRPYAPGKPGDPSKSKPGDPKGPPKVEVDPPIKLPTLGTPTKATPPRDTPEPALINPTNEAVPVPPPVPKTKDESVPMLAPLIITPKDEAKPTAAPPAPKPKDDGKPAPVPPIVIPIPDGK